MPSVSKGYEYDIFISYRHNDNRSGWVTEFVKSLQEELATTIKEPISVYFDSNPHDGLLENHHVDKSLEEKLKCLIFIPIVSQTYCDQKSFAWKNEFCVFNRSSQQDSLGRDVRLANGNVASRILPVKIHDLDAEDKLMLEEEVGSVLRAIEFIFKSPGVNRPLTSTDKREENHNKTFYRDQINKVANAIKEIINGIRNPAPSNSSEGTLKTSTRKPAVNRKIGAGVAILVLIALGWFLYSYLNTSGQHGKSIAVLPFVDMSPGKDQEYIGDGIAEEIINELTKIAELKVIGRTSSFQFKGEKVDLRDVGTKLQVATVLEGSVMKSGNKIRITAQLINVDDGSHIWSERYDRELEDVFSIQDEISSKIVQKLAAGFLPKGGETKVNTRTKNMEAYEMTMKGNYFIRQGPTGAGKALEYYKNAIKLDSNYAEAQIGYSVTHLFIGDSSEIVKAINTLKSLNTDPATLNEVMLTYYMWRKGDFIKSKQLYDEAVAAGFLPSITRAYYEGAIKHDLNKAIVTLEKVVERDPLFLDGLRNLCMFYLYARKFEKAQEMIAKMTEINSGYVDIYELKIFVLLGEKKFSEALVACSTGENQFNDEKMFLGSKMRALIGLGKLSEAKKLFYDLKVEADPSFNWRLANFYFMLEMEDKGFSWLESVGVKNTPFIIYALIDPIYDPYRKDPRFVKIIEKLNLP